LKSGGGVGRCAGSLPVRGCVQVAREDFSDRLANTGG
jgi:hypothetical protein